ncbi:hypothetical protein [Vibrio splendidus]|uniref:hypothetical protein n=1 Tax=Vibrio splendidus TaxID=29497 RepID=UPI000769BB4A|nr:hypothetical protein [Vibrio splendidus]PHX03575.1 hypothetical protein VSPL_49850 [Vibrio splendidus]
MKFLERFILRALLLLKWPLVIFSLYYVFPSSLVTDFSAFIKANSIKKMELTTGGFAFEVSEEQSIKNIEKAEELKVLADKLSNISAKTPASKESNEAIEEVKSKADRIVNSSVSAYAPSRNRDIVVGDAMTSVAEFQYKIQREEGNGFLLKVFIDKFPYKNEFDLCPSEGSYKLLTKVKSDKETATLVYVDEKVNCKSTLEISQLRGDEFLYSYNLIFLDGFNVAKVAGFDALLPKSIKRLRGNSVYLPSRDNTVGRKYVKGKEVEKETISITTF